ncbi:hypothetical protein [Rubritalea tangerina]
MRIHWVNGLIIDFIFTQMSISALNNAHEATLLHYGNSLGMCNLLCPRP